MRLIKSSGRFITPVLLVSVFMLTLLAPAAVSASGGLGTPGAQPQPTGSSSTDSGSSSSSSASSGGSSQTSTSSTSQTAPSGTAITCDSQGALSWIVCPVISLFQGFVNWFVQQINNLLYINTNTFFKTSCAPTDKCDPSTTKSGQAFYTAWASMRTIALVLLVLIGLIMVISQAIAAGPFDAYTVKKVLPRIMIAVIAVSLSWELMIIAINLTNELGRVVGDIIYAPFSSGFKAPSISTGTTDIFAAGIGIALIGTSLLAAFSLMFSAVISVFIAFGVLLIRQIVIVLLVMIAPLAIVCFVLPNTSKAWKLWWESFSKALLMYPIIIAFITAGRVFALAITNVPHPQGLGALYEIMAFAAYFAPLFMLPMTFRLAGGAMSAVGNFATTRGQGLLERQKKFRAGQREKTMAANKAGNRFKGGTPNNIRGRLNSALQAGSVVGSAGLRPTRWRAKVADARSKANYAAIADAMQNNPDVVGIMANDTLLNAAMSGRGTEADARAYLEKEKQSGTQLEQNLAAIQSAKRSVGEANFRAIAAVANAGTGTGYGGGPGDMLESINYAAGSDRALAGRLLADARGQATNARRYDLAGAGFGASIGQLDLMYAAGGSGSTAVARAMATANEALTDAALETQGAGAIIGGRGTSVTNLAPAINRRIQKAVMNSDRHSLDSNKSAAAERALQQVLAETAGLLDVAAQVSPENATILANKVLDVSYQVDGGLPKTVSELIELNRGDEQFGQMRREYASNATTAAAEAAAHSSVGGAGSSPIPPVPGTDIPK